MMLFAHWFACMWYLAARITSFGPDCWINYSGFANRDLPQLYLFSLYWSISTLFTVGYGDISAHTDGMIYGLLPRLVERIVSIVWMLCGAGFYTLTIGAMSLIMSTVDTKESILWEKLKVISSFCQEADINEDLCREMKKALTYNAENEGFITMNKSVIFDEMHPELKWKVIMEMHNHIILTIPFFRDNSKIFVAEIVPNLHPLLIKSNHIIYNWGDLPYDSISRMCDRFI